jgi:outer membrane receptor protein involved in Fe transport
MYEQFFQDGLALVAATKLRPETAHTVEASVERKLGTNWSSTAAGYYYRVNDLIAVYTPTGLPPGQYQNGAGVHAVGAEASIAGTLRHGVEVSASVAYQRSSTADHQDLPDSPNQVHKVRIGMPLFAGKLFLSGAIAYMGDRETLADASTGYALVSDFTLTTFHLTPEFDFQAGMRNAFNDRYYAPVGLAVDRMLQDGRSAYVKLIWHAKE